MSFILAEVAIFNLDKNNVLIQNLAKYGIEEEKESSGESKDTDDSMKEIDLSLHHHLEHRSLIMAHNIKTHQASANMSIKPGFKEAFFIPPDRA
jgi:hypothetical protein